MFLALLPGVAVLFLVTSGRLSHRKTEAFCFCTVWEEESSDKSQESNPALFDLFKYEGTPDNFTFTRILCCKLLYYISRFKFWAAPSVGMKAQSKTHLHSKHSENKDAIQLLEISQILRGHKGLCYNKLMLSAVLSWANKPDFGF